MGELRIRYLYFFFYENCFSLCVTGDVQTSQSTFNSITCSSRNIRVKKVYLTNRIKHLLVYFSRNHMINMLLKKHMNNLHFRKDVKHVPGSYNIFNE